MKFKKFPLFFIIISLYLLPSDSYSAKQKLSIEELKKAIEPQETKKGVLFTYDHREAQTVTIGGTFNNWDMNKNQLKKNKNNIWYVIIPLQKGKIEYKFIVDGKEWKEDPMNKNKLEDTYGGGFKSVMEIKTGVNLGGVMINGKKAFFKYYAPDAASVSLSGSFNQWNINSNPMIKDTEGFWTIELELISGKYLYKYVVNGNNWVSDTMNTNKADDGYGGSNSIFEIK